MGRYLDDARTLYQEALNELDRWQLSQDTALLRDAAEKAWRAVTQAANEVIAAHDRTVPHGARARQSILRELERENRQLRSLRLFDRFGNVEKLLHEECFYDGICALPLTSELVTEEVKEYLDDVEQVTQSRRR